MFNRTLMAGLVVLTIGLLGAACGPATPAPTTLPPTETQPPTPKPAPSATPVPTPSPTPTFMPLPALSGNKPYLMVQQDRESQELFIYDANGGRKIIELPPDGHIKGISANLNTIVSPDGQWLAFYTGKVGLDESLPVTLKLLNTADGRVKTVADVVMEGYGEKLGQLAEKLKKLYPDRYKPIEDNDWVGSGLIEAFEQGIYSIAWSPDSHTLAFAAQIDGLSSDVYLYDVETGAIRQAEDSLLSVGSVRWSPDGKKIVFENSEPGDLYRGVPELHMISPGKKAVKNPKTLSYQAWMGSFDPFTQTWSPTGDWLSPNVLLVASSPPESWRNVMEALNINTGQSTPLWRDSFVSYVVDEKNKIVLINASEFASPDNIGLYFITLGGRRTKVFGGLYYLKLFFRGGEKHRFLVSGISEPNAKVDYPMGGTAVGIGLDGKPVSLGDIICNQISVSPDYAWLLMSDAEKLYLYDTNDELIKTFIIPGIQRIIWRPDSQAIFYSAGSELYTLSLPAGEPNRVDNGAIEDAVWLP